VYDWGEVVIWTMTIIRSWQFPVVQPADSGRTIPRRRRRRTHALDESMEFITCQVQDVLHRLGDIYSMT
jgi:hypothetical protein